MSPKATEGGGGNLLSRSVLLLLQMTGRNRHLQKKGLGGKTTACPLRLKWMRWSRFAARRVDVSVRPATKPSGAAPGGFSLPPQKGDRTRFPGGLRAGKGGRMRRYCAAAVQHSAAEAFIGGPPPGNECFTPLNSPCEFNEAPHGRFFSIFLFDKRNMGPAAA